MHRFSWILLATGLLVAAPLHAQQSPFLDAPVYDALVNEVSGDIAFEHIRWFTHHHRPMGGSEGFEAVARYVEEKARAYNLEDVRTIRLETRSPSWTASLGELWLTAPEVRRLAFTPEVAISLADYSRPVDIRSAELVDVGPGTAESHYANRAVAGKVVLASGPLARVMDESVWKRGALGIVWFTESRRDRQDQVPWTRIPVRSEDDSQAGTFAFVLSQREGMRLRRELAAAGNAPFTVRAKIESAMQEPGSQSIVEAVIRGTQIHDRDIVLTAHLQEERFSANDDASGCASVLEIARALKRMIDDGRLPRPRRDIRFWWVDEISAEENYFSRHPEERRQLLVNINQDMVGARQSIGSRVQFVTRTPASRASFLSDVVESVVEALVQGNTSFLAAGMTRQLRRGQDGVSGGSVALEENPYTQAILARLGTRERYDARVIPFHNSTDHQVFNSAIVGVPGVTFTNWPDDYIHSSDDDLWQMDATQLERNAVAVAAVAYYIARAGDDEGPPLAAHVLAQGRARHGRELAIAAELIRQAPASARVAAWRRGVALVREGLARERRALQSVLALAPEGAKTPAAVAGLDASQPGESSAEAQLLPFWTAITGERAGPAVELTAREAELATRVPSLVDNVRLHLDQRRTVKRPPVLHALMAYEALNFVDGSRSVLDIARAVAAEADAAGEWYYGRVEVDDVAGYLESAAAAGLVTMRTRGAATWKGTAAGR
jgi:hypothetical protein